MPEREMLVQMHHIDKTFNRGSVNEKTVFSDFSLDIRRGDFVSVVGSNGSGKTTMLNLLCGSLPPDRGAIHVGGKDITRMPEHQRARFIGRVFQDPAKGTCPQLTILENMALSDNKGSRFDLTPGINRRRVDYYKSLLEKLGIGLENHINLPVGSLSGGQRQALALLVATMTPIDLLILDEHTAALDPKSSENVMELTQRVIDEKHLTTLMVTHNLKFAVNYGNRLLMMHQGQAVIDVQDEEKAACSMDRLLSTFNAISIECGN